MLLVRDIRLNVQQPQDVAIELAVKKLKLPVSAIRATHIHKLSVDARRRPPSFVYTIAVELADAAQEIRYLNRDKSIQVLSHTSFSLQFGVEALPGRVVVCGMGPAGLFAALELAEAGFRPLVLERGPEMARRRAAVAAFEAGGPLLAEANIQFGEGGAGTFSDGKLTTRINDPLCARVTERLLAAGAPAEIGYRAKPHIGTDLLQGVFTALRERLEQLGGEVRFNTRLTGLHTQGGRLAGVATTGGDIPCGALVLAVGHSARDTFTALAGAGLALQAKPFSVGMRIEHLQGDIDKGLYHEAAGHPALPPGEYQLATRVNGRGVYTFCMCPGGSVVAASSEEGGVVTNGMSLHARGGPNANAALVAGVGEDDFGADPFKAIAFQRELERAAFAAGGGTYAAPAETAGSFLEGAGKLALGRVTPSYPRGVQAASLGSLLPEGIAAALRTGLQAFGRKLPGFAAADAVLTGLETRTSSPVRIPRGEGLESVQLPGLWPCGEGAGYAGGIMSAATDGVRVAKAIIERYRAPE